MNNLALCQTTVENAYQRTLESIKVLSCQPTPVAPTGKEKAKKGKDASSSSGENVPTYDVTLSQTICFPEGGGQPSDTGLLTFTQDGAPREVKVLQVLRTPNGILHRVSGELAPESEVAMAVDWDRRYDHMQCHSTQHMISAIARKEFNLKTASWWLATAPQECHIEFDGIITPEQMAELEQRCNDFIRQGRQLKLHTYESLGAAKADEFFAANMQKAIPETHEGAIRVIEIGELDFNPCCGLVDKQGNSRALVGCGSKRD